MTNAKCAIRDPNDISYFPRRCINAIIKKIPLTRHRLQIAKSSRASNTETIDRFPQLYEKLHGKKKPEKNVRFHIYFYTVSPGRQSD